ncbi:MAG: glycosyltransferase [Puniceicoccaceae bacterium]
MKRRILVLTSSTGSGHDMRARAFAQWIRQEYGDQIEVKIEQVIENSSWLGRFGVWVYNTIQQHAPVLHNIYFHIVELFIFTHKGKVSFGGRYYRNLLQEFQPDTILSVHDSTNRGYFEDAKRLLGTHVRCVTYCGEFSGGYGFSRNWICQAADLFIARTHPTRNFAVHLGLSQEQTAVFHKFLPPASFEEPANDLENVRYLEQLGLDPKKFTVFLATGGYGANHHLDFLKAMLPLADRVQAIVICGRNQKIFEKVSQWVAENDQLTAYIEGYSDQVATFMQISDAIVTRGGANTTMEALHFGCPLLYNSLGGLMPQERCTVRYFLERGAASMIDRSRDLTRVLEEWSTFGETYKRIKSNLDELHYEEDPRELLALILGESPKDESLPESTAC